VPRDVLILSAARPTAAALRTALKFRAGLRVTEGRSGLRGQLEILCPAGAVALTLGPSQWVDNPHEVARLAPAATPRLDGPVWWTEGWAPWNAAGDQGVTAALLLAAALDGVCLLDGA
jgi:hypothetical protein